jgi:hypothetical protein
MEGTCDGKLFGPRNLVRMALRNVLIKVSVMSFTTQARFIARKVIDIMDQGTTVQSHSFNTTNRFSTSLSRIS